MAQVTVMEKVSMADLDAIVNGTHDNPYSVLGYHKVKGGYEVAAFFPGAEQVSLIYRSNGRKIADMDKIHDGGIFQVAVKSKAKKAPAYAYKVKFEGQKAAVRMGEPYGDDLLLESSVLQAWGEGQLWDAADILGAHPVTVGGQKGIRFAVWAPNARSVAVVGAFNNWDGRRNKMRCRFEAGIWEAFVPQISGGESYKFEIRTQDGALLTKADPFGRASEFRPGNASVTVDKSKFRWGDSAWMKGRQNRHAIDDPISIYELQAASWKKPDDGRDFLSYKELADQLIPYVQEMGFTHIQLMPITEYPFDGSWGYQPVGLFAPTSRFGTADDFRYFVNACHKAEIGVLFDWVPAHFPLDAHGLANFDGTCLYEHGDPRQGYHPDWNTGIFNYGRNEVRNYLMANALYWLSEFHIDGLRVDAVSSMLYLDYSREGDEWVPNIYGGNTNLEAVAFLQQLNHECYARNPGIMMVAEESTAWAGVSRPTDQDGLGFGYKWNLGWMHDSLSYMQEDPVHRKFHHDTMTFPMVYAYDENFMLSLSHDEVVHGKGSLLDRMPGDTWQKFANLRAYYGFMWAHPGKNLLFMGGEFGQGAEWNCNQSLDWHLLDVDWHKGVQNFVKKLNAAYQNLPALYEQDTNPAGFEWIQSHASEVSVFAWARFDKARKEPVVVVSNMTPVTREGYRIGLPMDGEWALVINSDDASYCGSDVDAHSHLHAEPTPWDGRDVSAAITLPPLSTLMYRKVS